jgi:tetratricopeptide (TPR) repeat protein
VLWGDEQLLAASLAKGGAWAKAVPHFERALALRTASVGDSHPDVALVLSSLGSCYGHVGEGGKARAAFERSIAIRETTFGKTSPALIVPLNNIADFLRRQGDVPAALASVERGKAIAEAAPGTAHPLYHTIATTYGEVLTAAGRLAEARTVLADVLALEAKTSSPVVAATQTALAAVALAQHAWLEAAELADHARAAIETGDGKDSADLVEPLTELALAKIQLKDPAAARVLLERAIAIGGKAQLDAPELAPAKAALAAL